MRATQGAWPEATGLAALGAGLVCLRISARRPAFKPYAWACFAITAVVMAVVLFRRYS